MNETRTRAILDALSAGARQKDVAQRFGVSRSHVSYIAVTHGFRKRSPRPEQPCESCGTVTRSTRRICLACRTAECYPEPTPEDALTGGRWVLDPVRRIQVWRAA